ncbi:16S rRNA (cytosine(967)-C(5))-methyltransferase RsmB [Kaistia dalseonensis]|uniref:16S rRNA (cytosine(967)-C(5))-methyltransferase n=1 Tax=Kaistia dalseonensis TaxID=410840 RepID=A0ABU0H4P4_9HYPH|nr:16S rRNA (cytosine(967)-C(5))-methyltransferase RsmB [Kaistia dalseonensis]MCX5494703.1 16S rRNA (cytosine(967)-C(5))-methyltransferase RsmB [Kaistia dalseonensis]MDQ0437284.1 16S rRNA (cytosine967-C5)-methyltransferase [Kaistia dalseonensis]
MGLNRPAPRKGNKSAAPARKPKLAAGVEARMAATAALQAVLVDHRATEAVLEATDGPFYKLDPRERGLARALLGTALRRHGQIRDALGRFLDKPVPKKSGPLAAILDIAAAQILFMDVPDHAAVSVAVDSAESDRDARHFKGLTNAVLRRLTEQRDAILADQDEIDLNTPDWLFRGWAKAYGTETARAIAAAHVLEPSLDITVKSRPDYWAEQLGGIVLPTGSIRLIAHGPIEALPGFAEGEWWVQDAAAALPARLLGPVEGKLVADLCAAPGGKTAQLAAAGAIVTAVDISEMRLARVRENLERLHLKVETVAADVENWTPDVLFDAILLDAPCSATGTIRRHPDVAFLKRPADIAALADLQFRLLTKATELLKRGGTLVYCTCSLEPAEGEAQIHRALGTLPLALEPVAPADVGGIDSICRDGFLRTLPSDLPQEEPRLSGLDGFFAARLRKL